MDNPLTEERMARMSEVIQALVLKFATEFPVQYKNALIKKIKSDAQPSEEDPRLLPDAPIPDWDLKTGMMEKQGGTYKNWKPRFFKALNKADNYKIEYFVAEGGAKKGEINCCGYSCENFSQDDAEEFKCEFGLKLVPRNDIRRTWLFKCPDEKEREDWKRVFENACRKADPPKNEDIVIHEAFVNTLRIVRWFYGYWGWYSVDGTEAESLGFFCSEVLDRELINQVIYDIPSGPARGAIVRLVRSTVNTNVVAAVGAAWNAGVAACQGLRGTLESAVKSLLDPIFEQEVSLKAQVVDKVGAVVNPFMEDAGGRICQPVFRVCSSDITKSYVSAIGELHAFMKDKMSGGELDADKFAHTMKYAHWYMDYWWSGPIHKTNQVVWKIYTSDLTEIAGYFSGGFSAYSLYSDTLDAVRDLAHRALYSFEAAAKTSDYTNLEAIWADTGSKMVHDAKLSEKALLVAVLTAILQPMIEENVIKPCVELVAPIQDVINAIPVPGLSDLFNLSDMVEECLGSIVDNGLAALTEGASGEVVALIQNQGDSLGLPAI